MKKFINKELNKFSTNFDKWQERVNSWDNTQNVIEAVLRKIVMQINSKKVMGITRVYMNREKETIQLYFGSQPVGVSLSSENALEVETGAALVYSRGVDGSVACFIYNCCSNQMSPLKKYFVYKIYSKPSKISEKEITKAAEILLLSARYSSCTQKTSIIENIKYLFYSNYYEICSIFRIKDLSAIIIKWLKKAL